MEKSLRKIYNTATAELEKDAELEKETEKPKFNIESFPKEWQILEIIAKRVGGDFGMKIRLGEPGGGSFFDSKDASITFDPLHIKENPELAKFVAGHEGAHRAITPSPKEIGLTDEQTKKYYSQIGFGYLQNAVEDPAVNSWMIKRFPGLRECTNKTYDKQLKEENAVLATPEIEKMAIKLGRWPRFVQYGSEIIRDWHQKRFSKKLDPAVEKALQRTIKYVRKSIQTIPDPTKPRRDRKEILKTARERFQNNTLYIWPEVKKIVEMDLETEQQRQTAKYFRRKQEELEQKIKEMKEAREQGDTQKAGDLQKEIDNLKQELEPFSELPEDVKKELEKQIDKAVKEIIEELSKEIEEKKKEISKTKQSQEKIEKELQDLKEKLKNATGEEKKNLKKQIKEKEAEKLIQGMKQKQAEKDFKDIQDILKDIQSGKEMPYPENELPDEIKKELDKLFKKLPKKRQKDIEDESRKTLEDLEDSLNKEIEGKLSKEKPESHKERRERKEQEEEIKKQRKKTEEEKKELERKLEQSRREKMTEYDKTYEEVADIINSLYRQLKKFFLLKRHPRWQKGYPTGQKVDLDNARQAEADPRYLEKIWQRKTIPKKFDYRFSILVDLSGSMDEEKIEETFKGVVVLAEVLEKLGIKYEILGFQDEIIPYKKFRDKLNKEIRDKLSIAKKEPSNEGIHNKASWNSDGYCLQEAYKRILKNKGRDNFLIVLSDGLPEPDLKHSGKEYELKGVIDKIIKDRQVKLLGIGLGPDTEHVKDYYPYGLPNLPMRVTEQERSQGKKDFAEAFAGLLEDMIKHPEKY